mmetsp:Transcript_71096/g.161491  ORF Transcript_71096/g.161491 Transcript_71096/m.161491 type:complete len:215 (-) Transcript_71096:60-704(-)
MVPSSLDASERLGFEEAVRKAQVVNLRTEAARRLLDATQVGTTSAEFAGRAVDYIRNTVECGERPVGPGGAGVDTTRVFAYAEYTVVSVGGCGPQAEGRLFRESGLARGAGAGQPQGGGQCRQAWLRPFRLPTSGHVDRSLCAEFQVLNELCSILAPEGGARDPRPAVAGVVDIFTTASPCMSCLGAIRQFQLLFPEVSVAACELDGPHKDHRL